MKLMEHLLSWTLDELKNPTQETLKLDWGSETSRLPPTLVVAAELHSKPFPEGNPPPAPPPGFVPFLSPIIANKNIVPGQSNNVSALLVLTEAETAKYREACRRNGVTVTDLMLALIALAEVEMALQLAIKNKDAAAADPYEQATHFLIGFYFMNHVRLLPCSSSISESLTCFSRGISCPTTMNSTMALFSLVRRAPASCSTWPSYVKPSSSTRVLRRSHGTLQGKSSGPESLRWSKPQRRQRQYVLLILEVFAC